MSLDTRIDKTVKLNVGRLRSAAKSSSHTGSNQSFFHGISLLRWLEAHAERAYGVMPV